MPALPALAPYAPPIHVAPPFYVPMPPALPADLHAAQPLAPYLPPLPAPRQLPPLPRTEHRPQRRALSPMPANADPVAFTRKALERALAPVNGCPSQRFANQQAIRQHLQGAFGSSTEADRQLRDTLQKMGLVSLLTDDPDLMPGTLDGMHYDLGHRLIEAGFVSYEDPASVDKDDYLFWGKSETSALQAGGGHRGYIESFQRSLLSLHRHVAGLPRRGPATHDDFVAQLAHCQAPTRSTSTAPTLPTPAAAHGTPAEPDADDGFDIETMTIGGSLRSRLSKCTLL